MTTGLILLVFIGVLVGYGWTRLRGRMKLKVSGADWIGPVLVVVVLGMMLWATYGRH